jgi:hypothetical protein
MFQASAVAASFEYLAVEPMLEGEGIDVDEHEHEHKKWTSWGDDFWDGIT